MARFLLDANVSHETRAFLQHDLRHDAVHISALGFATVGDDKIVELAIREQRIVITFDLDFGRMYRIGDQGGFGAIVLRLDDQSIEATNERLRSFLSDFTDHDALRGSLVILEDRRIRVINNPR